MDRRHFLTTSLMTVAAFKVSSATPALAAPAVSVAPPPYVFSGEAFRSLVGTDFQLSAADWRGSVRLDEIVDGPETAEVDQFIAVFSSAGRPAPAEGLYDVDHPQAGRFSLRVDGHDASGTRRATFALLRA
jgi:hypothetical protein